MQNILEFKNNLKNLKKQIGSLFLESEKQLQIYENLLSRMSIINMSYHSGLGLLDFDKNELNKIIPLIQRSVIFSNELENIGKLINKHFSNYKMPNICLTGSAVLGSRVYVKEAKDNDAISFLKREAFISSEDNIGNLLETFVLNNDLNYIYKAMNIYINFYNLLWGLNQYLIDITMLINAIDNEKIIAPINDIGILYSNLLMFKVPFDDISRIIGRAVNFNKEYVKKNSHYKFKNIELNEKLALFYNIDGSFNSKFSGNEFENLLLALSDNGSYYFKFLECLFELLYLINDFSYDISFDNYGNINEFLREFDFNSNNITDKEVKSNNNLLKINNNFDRDFSKYLSSIYSFEDDIIIGIPSDIEVFYQRLLNSNLSQGDKKHIRKLMNEYIKRLEEENRVKWLNDYQKNIYTMASRLVFDIDIFNPDSFSLKQILGEVNDILDVINGDISNQDREELLNDLFLYIDELSLICDRNIVNGNVKKLKVNK